jgi:hypothetical protein
MEQANKPTFGQIATLGLLGAIAFGVARYLRDGVATPIGSGISTFLATIGWLFLIGAVVLMLLWLRRA